MRIRESDLSFAQPRSFYSPPRAIERLSKIVVPKGVAPLSPTPEPNRKAIITPQTPVITPIAVEKKRQEIVQSLELKNNFLRTDRGAFQTKFIAKPIIQLREMDMRIPLGRTVSTPRAMPITRDVTNRPISFGLPKDVVNRIRMRRMDEPVISVARPVFRKNFIEVAKDIDKPITAEQKDIISPKTKTLVQTLVPIAALVSTVFLRK